MLKTKIQKDKPVVIFVQETKCTTEVTTQLMSKISKGCLCVTIDARGALGGISICQNPLLITLTNLASSPHYVYALIHLVGTSIKGHLLNLYAPQSSCLKLKLINYIEWLSIQYPNSPILIGVDFNDDNHSGRKKGRSKDSFQWGPGLQIHNSLQFPCGSSNLLWILHLEQYKGGSSPDREMPWSLSCLWQYPYLGMDPRSFYFTYCRVIPLACFPLLA